MSYTRKEWWLGVLHLVGNDNPTPFIIDYGIAWTQDETSPGRTKPGESAAYNLLNTTEQWKADGTEFQTTNFNSVGVKNYASFEDGIEANARVLRNGRYPELAAALEHNNETALKKPDNGIMQELQTWGTGHVAFDLAAKASNPASLLPDEAFPGEGPTGGLAPVPVPKPALPSLAVKLGDKEDFKLVLDGSLKRYVVGLKHSSEEKMKKAGYI